MNATHYETFPIVDINVLSELRTMLDDNSVDGIVQDFRSLSQELVNDLSHASANNNTNELTMISHSLKSNCMQLGAVRLGELCRLLEEDCRSGVDAHQRDYVSMIKQTLQPTLEQLR